MSGAMPISGSTTSLRPTGVGRYFGAAFLAFWLAGWAIGETFALAMLAAMFGSLSGVLSEQGLPAFVAQLSSSGAATFVILFLLVWLTFWTFGGIAAIAHVLRMLAGEDRLTVQASGFELVRRAGPFHRVRAFDRSSIRRVRIRHHDKALVADTAGATHVITQYGTVPEREAVGEWLRRSLSLGASDATMAAPPTTWEVTTGEGGVTRLRNCHARTRRIRSLLALIVAGAVSIGWFASLSASDPFGSVAALALTVALACGAAFVTFGTREWIVRAGQLTFRRRFATFETEQTFTSGRLEVTQNSDSDSDQHYTLAVRDSNERRTIYRQINDSGETIDFARWLAGRTGFPLALPPGAEPPRTSRISDDEMRLPN